MGTDAEPAPEDLPEPAPSSVSPDTVRDWRWQLTRGEDQINTATWAGSVPQATGIAPRIRVGRGMWFNLLWLLPIGLVLLLVAVAVAKGLRGDPAIQRFIARYPGTLYSARARAATGFPAWLRWQHFFNLFFMLFMIRAGVQILSDHPRLYWTPALHPGPGLVPDPETGAGRSVVDCQAGLDQPPGAGRPARAPPLHRAGPLVASEHGPALAG